MLHCIYLAPQLYLQKGLLRIKSFIHSSASKTSTVAAIAMEKMGKPSKKRQRLFAKRQREKALWLLLSAELLYF